MRYNFKQLETAFVGFIANFEKKVNNIFPGIPVLMENIDDAFFHQQKYSKTEYQELYHKVPRIVLVFNDVSPMVDQNTTQYLKMKYLIDDTEVESQFRHISTRITIEAKLVASNYLKALQYWEFISSIMFFDNAFTYKFNGNTYQASYWSDSGPQIEKTSPSLGTSESRNVVVGCQITLALRPTILNIYNSRITDNKLGKSLTDLFLFDDTILTNPNTNIPNGLAVGKDESGNSVIINSVPNSTTGVNDISMDKDTEITHINDKTNVLKRSNNVFMIYQKMCEKDSHTNKQTYRSLLKPEYIKAIPNKAYLNKDYQPNKN